MHINLVTYQKVFPLGAYINEKIGVEISLEAGEDATIALDTARNLVHEYHEKNNPVPIYEDSQLPEKQVDNEPPTKLSKEEKQRKCITDTTTLDGINGLLSFAFLVSKNPHLQETYDNHLKKLQNV